MNSWPPLPSNGKSCTTRPGLPCSRNALAIELLVSHAATDGSCTKSIFSSHWDRQITQIQNSVSSSASRSNQLMKATPKAFASRLAPWRSNLNVFATTPCRGLSLSRRVQRCPAAKSLDFLDALGVKDVYAPKRKQGESEH